MNLMPNTITPRTPLTLAELETLATMLDTGTQHMNHARDAKGKYAWPVDQYSNAIAEMFAAFFEIRDNTAILAVGQDGWPWDAPHARVTVTSVA
jgi:hypothetical protein